MRNFFFNIFIFSLFILLPSQLIFAGSILSDYKYAWSNNVGYINFIDVVVSDDLLSGYAWSANSGWIKFNPATGGVLNDGNGNLSGYAWGENLGWIDFDNVNINSSTGVFSGTATGDIIGTLTFDCSNCDVRTDWSVSSGNSSGYMFPKKDKIPIIFDKIPEEIKESEDIKDTTNEEDESIKDRINEGDENFMFPTEIKQNILKDNIKRKDDLNFVAKEIIIEENIKNNQNYFLEIKKKLINSMDFNETYFVILFFITLIIFIIFRIKKYF